MKTGRLNLKWQDIDMAKLDLGKLILHFEQSNKAEGKSPKTVSQYSEMLGVFVKFLELKGKPLNAHSITISSEGNLLNPYR